MNKTRDLFEFLREAVPGVLRKGTGTLKHDFLVPGAIYGAEQWDWDSYWMVRGMLALANHLDDDDLRRSVVRHGQGCLYNVFEHQGSNGALPIMMRADNPDVFGCLDPEGPEVNQAKPIFGQFAKLISGQIGDTAWFEPLLEGLDRFYKRWKNHYGSQIGLLAWGSDVGIGIDNDPAAYGRPGFSCASLLLNCLYIQDLEDAADVAAAAGRNDLAAAWRKEALDSSEALVEIAWDPRDGFFYSHDLLCEDHRQRLIPWAEPGMAMSWKSLPIRIQGVAGFLPLWCGVAQQPQAQSLFRHIHNPDTFLAAHGIRTLSRREPMYSLAASGNPSNWLGPVWILSNYFVWYGLRRYGWKTEADRLTRKTLNLLQNNLKAHGALHEYYHPDTGEPLMNKGFFSWNFLVCEMCFSQ